MVEVITAYYGQVGSSKDRLDVTDRLKKLVSTDKKTLALLVSPSNIGVPDPAPGNPKQLDIRYSVDNQEHTEIIPDASTLLVKANGPTPQSWIGFTFSSITNMWYQILIVVAVFLYIMSIAFAFEFGRSIFNPFLWLVIALVLPFVSFWAIPVLIILMRIFSSQDFILLRGGRR